VAIRRLWISGSVEARPSMKNCPTMACQAPARPNSKFPFTCIHVSSNIFATLLHGLLQLAVLPGPVPGTAPDQAMCASSANARNQERVIEFRGLVFFDDWLRLGIVST
jgi:hypothetical protein